MPNTQPNPSIATIKQLMTGPMMNAPNWETSQWFNTDSPLSIERLRGKVIVLHSFQMLCPGCAIHALPQAQRVHDFFDERDVMVVGLHTVFEHHAVMGPDALSAFLHEYRYSFPVGVDQQRTEGSTPATMAAYGLRGTPSLVLIDRYSRIRFHQFGRIDDLELAFNITTLIEEKSLPSSGVKSDEHLRKGCSDDGCAV